MSFGMAILGLLLAGRLAAQSDDGPRRFRVDLPPQAESGQTHLLLHNVTVPRNLPTVLRVYALTSDSAAVYLGSTGLPAISPDAQGNTTVKVLRINVTTGLRRLLAKVPGAREVDLEIRSEGKVNGAGQNRPWSVCAVELVRPKD
jgi:hypothetical protein